MAKAAVATPVRRSLRRLMVRMEASQTNYSSFPRIERRARIKLGAPHPLGVGGGRCCGAAVAANTDSHPQPLPTRGRGGDCGAGLCAYSPWMPAALMIGP